MHGRLFLFLIPLERDLFPCSLRSKLPLFKNFYAFSQLVAFVLGSVPDESSDLSQMKRTFKRFSREIARLVTGWLPRRTRFAVYRNMVRCDEAPPAKLVLKLAETQEELEACFRLLHDAYVEVGFMKPDPSGLRVTTYHALPTTTTLLAKFGDRIVGTISLIRESTLGFPLQKIFDITDIRRTGGNIAEVSALAVDRHFQSKGGMILFPLMKFMYEYATKCFDTRHLVIAVNPRHIGLYESLLFFGRLRSNPVEHYDFVNGAPAVGAHLDLQRAAKVYKQYYDHKAPEKNLYRYFTKLRMPNIIIPDKRFYTTNDPVMTPELIDYFFNKRTQAFLKLTDRERVLLHSIYDLPEYKHCLPPMPIDTDRTVLKKRQHQRFSVMCPASLEVNEMAYEMRVIECSRTGFRARSGVYLPLGLRGTISVRLGAQERSLLKVFLLRQGSHDPDTFVFKVEESDGAWRKFVNALRMARTHGELEHATQFVP